MARDEVKASLHLMLNLNRVRSLYYINFGALYKKQLCPVKSCELFQIYLLLTTSSFHAGEGNKVETEIQATVDVFLDWQRLLGDMCRSWAINHE